MSDKHFTRTEKKHQLLFLLANVLQFSTEQETGSLKFRFPVLEDSAKKKIFLSTDYIFITVFLKNIFMLLKSSHTLGCLPHLNKMC